MQDFKKEMVTIPIQGEITREPLSKVPGYEEIKAALNGGFLEVVPFFDKFEDTPCVVFCDEEGKLKNMAMNLRATLLWQQHASYLDDYDILVGPVVIIKGDLAFLRRL